MATVRSLCVYCGSGSGHAEAYGKAAVELGAAMAKANIRLVYGGGGIGTLEELVEQLTLAQLGRHAKPVVVANIGGFWDPLRVLLDHMKDEGFIRPGLQVKYSIIDEVRDIIPAIQKQVADLPQEALGAEHDPMVIEKM